MVEVARYFMEFSMTESCGKCIPCRVGTVEMHRLLTRFAEKRATAADLALLEGLCDLTRSTSLCGLGQAAPNPVLSTLRYFRREYLDAMAADESSGGDATNERRPLPAVIPLTVVATPSDGAQEGGRS
jgi:bidirectional [NiFe] hydrogenase diaphorase subunit